MVLIRSELNASWGVFLVQQNPQGLRVEEYAERRKLYCLGIRSDINGSEASFAAALIKISAGPQSTRELQALVEMTITNLS
jgi:hypothetical protein